MDRVKPREDWPFGPALKAHRMEKGWSVKAAARRTKPKISDGRWYQLESGYQPVAGQRMPIGTTPATVAAVARAVEWDVNEALAVAGFDPIDLPAEKVSPLELVTDDELLNEVRRRLARVDSRLRLPHEPQQRGIGPTAPWGAAVYDPPDPPISEDPGVLGGEDGQQRHQG